MRFSARNIRTVELRRTLECVLRKDYASILKKIQPYKLIHRAGIKSDSYGGSSKTNEKRRFSAESSGSSANASPKSTSLLPPKPRASTLCLITCIDFLSLSQKTQCAPRGKVFPAQGCRCRKKIQYLCVFNIELNHAEHGFLYPVESRARVSALRCIESPAASRTCNNTQFQSSEYNILILPLSKGEFQPPMQYFRTKSELFFRLTHFCFAFSPF